MKENHQVTEKASVLQIVLNMPRPLIEDHSNMKQENTEDKDNSKPVYEVLAI